MVYLSSINGFVGGPVKRAAKFVNSLATFRKHLLAIGRSINLLESKHKLHLHFSIGTESFALPESQFRLAQLLYKMDYLEQAGDLDHFLGMVSLACAQQKIPSGKLDLFAAFNQFDRACAGLSRQDQRAAEAGLVFSAIMDNLEIADRYKEIMDLLTLARGATLEAAAEKIVTTARKLWPGGNPTLMLYAESDGERYLIPLAVALDRSIVEIGQELFGKDLGKYRIKISEESRNPYVQKFLEGKLDIEEDITYQKFAEICAGFVDHELGTRAQGFLKAMSFKDPKKEKNALLFAPISTEDATTKEQRPLGIFALLKKGHFSREDLKEIDFFLNVVSLVLSDIRWRDDLKRTATEAEAYAQEKAEYARQLLEMQARMVQRERLAAAGELAEIASHSFKNALAALAALVDRVFPLETDLATMIKIVEAKAELGISVQQEIEALNAALQELEGMTTANVDVLKEAGKIVQGMLSFAKVGSGKKQDVPLKRFIRDHIKIFQKQAERERISVIVNTRRLSDKDGIRIDPSELTELVGNLVKNAIEAFAEKNEGAKIIRFAVMPGEAEKDKIIFVVHDNGVGIAEERLPTLFCTWGKSTKKDGTGLGMVTIKKIVDANGGKIKVESKIGEYTEFTATFPRVEAQPALVRVRRAGGMISKKEAGRLELMMIEDDPRVQGPIKSVLEGMGFPVTVFTTAEEAYCAVVEKDLSPDFILCDQTLPKMKGHEFLLRLAGMRELEDKPIPKLAIHSGDIPPSEGPIAEAVRKLNIAWIEKGADVDHFRSAVSAAARGEGMIGGENGMSLKMEYEDNAYFRLISGIIHKMNGRLTTLYYIQMDGYRNFALAKENFRVFEEDLRHIASFVADAHQMNFGERRLEEEFGEYSFMREEAILESWQMIPARRRYKIALAFFWYFDKIDNYLAEISRMMRWNSIDEAEKQRIFDIMEEIQDLHKVMRLSKEGSQMMANYYRLLEQL